MQTMKYPLTLVLVLAATNLMAASEVDELAAMYGDAETVSIATGTKQPIHIAPSVASVITAEDIAKVGATDINQVLELVPGLHVYPSNLNRLNWGYSIRGIQTAQNPQVLLLLDGIPVQDLYEGSRPMLFRLPVSNIERIEVVRGPGSAVYGADAYAGVINIITKTGKDIAGTKFQILNGSFGTRGLAGQYGGAWHDWDIAFSAEMQKTNGDLNRRVDSDLQTALDGAFGSSASLAPGPLSTRYNILDTHLRAQNEHWTWSIWRWDLSDAGVGAGAAQALDPNANQETSDTIASLAYNTATNWGHWDTKYSYTQSKYKVNFTLLPPSTTVLIGADGNIDFAAPVGVAIFPDGIFGFPGATTLVHKMESVATGQIEQHSWRIAIGAKNEKLTDTNEQKNFGPGVIDTTGWTMMDAPHIVDGTLTDVTGTENIYMQEHSRNLLFLSLQDEWAFMPDWRFTAGTRFDHYSDFGTTTNPRLALVWEARYNLTTKLLYGRAFRAPTFSEQYAINNPVALGNPDIDPETIDTVELAFDYRPTYDVVLDLNIFYYKAKDLIDFAADTGATTNTAQNARDQNGQGAEFEFAWKTTDKLKLWGNTSLQNATDDETGDRIPDAPRLAHTAGFDWAFLPQWNLTPRVNMITDRARASTDTRDEIDDYTVTDISVRRTGLNKAFDISLTVRNVFDTDAREPTAVNPLGSSWIPNDYPMEGRAIYAQINANFD